MGGGELLGVGDRHCESNILSWWMGGRVGNVLVYECFVLLKVMHDFCCWKIACEKTFSKTNIVSRLYR